MKLHSTFTLYIFGKLAKLERLLFHFSMMNKLNPKIFATKNNMCDNPGDRGTMLLILSCLLVIQIPSLQCWQWNLRQLFLCNTSVNIAIRIGRHLPQKTFKSTLDCKLWSIIGRVSHRTKSILNVFVLFTVWETWVWFRKIIASSSKRRYPKLNIKHRTQSSVLDVKLQLS